MKKPVELKISSFGNEVVNRNVKAAIIMTNDDGPGSVVLAGEMSAASVLSLLVIGIQTALQAICERLPNISYDTLVEGLLLGLEGVAALETETALNGISIDKKQ